MKKVSCEMALKNTQSGEIISQRILVRRCTHTTDNTTDSPPIDKMHAGYAGKIR